MQAIEEPPRLILRFSTSGITLQKFDDYGLASEYPVSPSDLAILFTKTIPFNTDIIPADTVLIQRTETTQLVVGYRPPQITALWLDGSTDPLRIPLPGLVLLRAHFQKRLHYSVYACLDHPRDAAQLAQPLMHCPLPNVSTLGPSENICWGTVQLPEADLNSINLTNDWNQLLGSRFGNHSVNGKSKKHKADIRKMLLYLDKHRKVTDYPVHDLVPANKTIGDAIRGMVKD